MEKFKLDNFKTTYHKSMPVEKSLSKNESEAISTSLFQKLNLKKTDYFQEKESCNFNIIGHLNAGTYYINWDEVFQKMKLSVPREIYINEHNFENLDIMLFDNFKKYFTDIWYPAADDIEIFDATLNWIIVIRHFGTVYYKKV